MQTTSSNLPAELDAAIAAYVATAARFDARAAEGFDHAAHERALEAAYGRIYSARRAIAAKGGAS